MEMTDLMSGNLAKEDRIEADRLLGRAKDIRRNAELLNLSKSGREAMYQMASLVESSACRILERKYISA